MKRIHDRTRARLAELFVKAGLIAAIAAALSLPASINAHGAEAAPLDARHSSLPAQHMQAIRLPPIPHLDAIPWLALDRASKGPRIDLLVPASVERNFALTGLPLWSAGIAATTQGTNG